MISPISCRPEWNERQPEQQVEIGPKSCAMNPLTRVQQVVMVVPVDPHVNETQDVTQQNGDTDFKAARLAPCGIFNSSTIIVMMTARTPSLKASRRPLFMVHFPPGRQLHLVNGRSTTLIMHVEAAGQSFFKFL